MHAFLYSVRGSPLSSRRLAFSSPHFIVFPFIIISLLLSCFAVSLLAGFSLSFCAAVPFSVGRFGARRFPFPSPSGRTEE